MKSLYLSKFDSECGNSYKYHFIPPSSLLDSKINRFRDEIAWPAGVNLSKSEKAEEVDCVIVGGGLAAITLACYFYHVNIDFVIVDPHERLAENFKNQVDRTNQRVMRSPYEHYVGCHRVYDYSLLDFAKIFYGKLSDIEKEQVILASAGHRGVVPIDIFLYHLMHQINAHELSKRHYIGFAEEYSKEGELFSIYLDSGHEIKSKFLVHATGEKHKKIDFESCNSYTWNSPHVSEITESKVLVVGAGQTAANVTEMLIDNSCMVDIAFPGDEINFRCVDSTPHFFRPAGRVEANLSGNTIKFPASMMLEYEEKFKNHEKNGYLRVIPNVSLVKDSEGKPVLQGLNNFSSVDRYDYIIQCLGLENNYTFTPKLPVSLDCSISPNEYVIGANAREAVGPAARNIDGHRVAAERIVSSIIGKIGV